MRCTLTIQILAYYHYKNTSNPGEWRKLLVVLFLCFHWWWLNVDVFLVRVYTHVVETQ